MQADDDKAVDLVARGWTISPTEGIACGTIAVHSLAKDGWGNPLVLYGEEAVAAERYVDLRVREALMAVAEEIAEHEKKILAPGRFLLRYWINAIKEKANGG